jgi:hypothetical protein
MDAQKWRPRVHWYRGLYGEDIFVAILYKGEIQRRVNDNVKAVYSQAWYEVVAAANKLNKRVYTGDIFDPVPVLVLD